MIQDIKPKAMANKDNTTYLIVECTIAEDMDQDGNFINIHNEEYLFEFINEGNGYCCSKYIDIPFGILEIDEH